MVILFLTAFLFCSSSEAKVDLHEFHFSKCDIEYSEGEQALQIAIRIFIDDLEEALAQDGVTELKLCTSKEAPHAEKEMESYLKKRFIITVDGAEQRYNFLGKETSEDLMAVWCYLEIEEVSPQESISIKNSILMETFDDQKNMVVLKYSKEIKEHFLFQVGEDTSIMKIN